MVPIKKDDDEEFRLKFIPSGYMSAGELAIEPAKKEIETFSRRILTKKSLKKKLCLVNHN